MNLFPFCPSVLAILAAAVLCPCQPVIASQAQAPAATEVFSFSNIFIENLHVLPNGSLLLSTLVNTGLLYTLDPNVATPVAYPVTTFNSSTTTGLSGIAALSDDLYAVTGGLHASFSFLNNSMHLDIISMKARAVVHTIPVLNTTTLNGLAALPSRPSTLLSADSIGSRILRIDTLTGTVDTAFYDPAFAPGAVTPPIGINGLRIVNNYLYFTNSDQATFGRVLIDANGNKAGSVQILATMDGTPDDFAFDSKGNAYVAVHDSAVVKIAQNGDQIVVGNSSLFREPTSAALSADCKSMYISTGGSFTNATLGGQVIRVPL